MRSMFHHRSSAFAPNITALECRLHALEKELEKIGRIASRRASAGVSAAGDNIGDAIASAVTEIVDRFRSGRRLAGDEAVRFRNEAPKFDANASNHPLHRVPTQIQHPPPVPLPS